MKEEQIRIQMLGGFRISAGENSVAEISKRAPKLWRVLQYLIAFRHKTVSQEELVSAIWPENQGGDPGSAMRNMMFRLRSALASSGLPFGAEMILHSGGGYSWNNLLDCTMDFEEFEKLYNRACADDITKQARIETLLQAIDLYKGDFLPNASCEMWAMPIVSYYRAMYFKCVHVILELLLEQKSYSQAEMVCKKALLLDQFEEKIHEYHLRSLIGQEKQAAALAEYQKTTALFYEELGVNPSESLRSVYLDIQKMNRDSNCTLEDLMKEWIQSADFPGAYYCEYGVFKIIYQLEARSVARSGKSIYAVSIVIKDDIKKNKKAEAVMPNLKNIIQSSLRKGDVFTRAAPNQCVLMLQGLTYENCKMLSKRILRAHNQKHRAYPLEISIRPITPIS